MRRKEKNSLLIQAFWGSFPRGGPQLKGWGLGKLRYLPTQCTPGWDEEAIPVESKGVQCAQWAGGPLVVTHTVKRSLRDGPGKGGYVREW